MDVQQHLPDGPNHRGTIEQHVEMTDNDRDTLVRLGVTPVLQVNGNAALALFFTVF